MTFDHGQVVDKNGARGALTGATASDRAGERVLVKLESGATVWIPSSGLEQTVEGNYYLRSSFGDLLRESNDSQNSSESTIPVIEEEVEVGKRRVEKGGVRIAKTVEEREEVIDEPIDKEEADIQRVPVNRFVDAPVAVRREGDTLIIPLLEEVVVTEKRLLLREELHITKRHHEERFRQTVPRTSEQVSVEPLQDEKTD